MDTLFMQQQKMLCNVVSSKEKTYFPEVKSITVKSIHISGFHLMKTNKKKQCMANMESSIDPKAFQASALV